MIAKTPEPPYYAVIFTSIRTDIDEGYEQMAQLIHDLATEQTGYLGLEAAREALGVTVSYWTDLDSIRQWKANAQHILAQKLGRDKWYQAYKTRICLVERDYDWKV